LTTIKHSFSLLNSTDNALWGVMLEVNNATEHFLGYGIIFLVFIVSSFVFIRRTQDLGKSLLSSSYIATVISIILYYAGKTSGVTFISDVFMFGLLTITATATATIYYFRTNK
jgi:hypothetical protein